MASSVVCEPLRDVQGREGRQELLGAHRDRHQALDQVDDPVRAALLAQEIVQVVRDARRLVRLYVVAVDDPLQWAATRNWALRI